MFRFVLPAIAWTIIVTILTLLPGKDLPDVHIVNFDKFAHVGVFFLLSLLYSRWKLYGKGLNVSLPVIVVVIILYGGLIEILQGTFYTDRYADIYDFIANGVGAILGGIICPLLASNKG